MLGLTNQLFSRYKGIATWVWHDAICRFSRLIVKSVFANMASLGCQVAAFAIVFFFAKALEQNKTCFLFGHAFNSRSAGVIISVGLLAFFLFLVSALLAYSAAMNSIQLRRNYAEFCFKRALVLGSRLPDPTMRKANQMLAKGELKSGLRSEAEYCGRFLHQLAELILPTGSLVAYSVFLFAVSLLLSMMIFPLIAVSSILLKRINSSASQTSRDLKRYAEQASLKRRLLLQRMFGCASPIEYSDRFMNEFFSRGKSKDYFDAFYRRFIFAERSRLMVSIMMSTAVLGIIIVAATGVMSKNWSVIFAYLVALRAASSSLSHLGSGVTQLGRFFPHVETYYDFVGSAQPIGTDVGAWADGTAVHLEVPSMMNGMDGVILSPNQPVFLLNPGPVDRILASQFQIRTFHEAGTRPIRYWFVEKEKFKGNTLRECLGLPPSLTEAEIKKKLVELCSDEMVNEILPISFESPLEEGEQKEIPSRVLSAIKLIAGVYSNCQVIIVSDHDVARANLVFKKSLTDIMSDRILIRSCRELPATSLENEESLVLIANGKELVGWCLLGWLDRNSEVLRNLHLDTNRHQDMTEDLTPHGEDEYS